ncbi:Flagellar biosynthetic protein fliR [Listeria grayi]|uniref:Flagellar biosynthesis protein FliR n=2 Tax=Listeria grayi TaxID=1641 RepID=D7V0C8_LISGR|nr:flagellar biosynthetic protein FliR [Listeria grayi]EFI83021.1 flagellar biosynthesis protein FliR [Listeria grayi DSM 20601]EUJ29013.1 flagellar biosynthesis protein FliR [Listeria grayi FSL F6-1183]VEI35510.1 Flagellar biosynthetic protein fliR [Listeria grayi]
MEFQFLLATVIAFSRIASFIYFFPLLKSTAIPNSVKVIFGLALSFPVAGMVKVGNIHTLTDLLIRVSAEVVFGLALAKLIEMIALVPKMAGFMIDYDLGFSQVNLIDPSYGTQNSITAAILDTFFVIVFLSLQGLDYLMFYLLKSFQFTASIQILFEQGFIRLLIATLAFALTSAVSLALPIMGSIFIVNIILAFISKSAPQINIFMNAFMVKITLGIFILACAVPVISTVFRHLTNDMIQHYISFFDSLLKN